ncbi:MAG: hypothetical protein NC180_02970 [Muribaculaceae bacterium]|nr:hypothetical protein [Roseburia sp.]MCM1430102.1 hypothetical protein [Muribaculaceae bacterium]MCM1492167.1 hypothetical protein [Muribaculaceae bacterium]
MRRLKRSIVAICMAFVLCFAFSPLMVQAADINVTLGTTDNGVEGDTVTARIVLGENPGISTFAVKLAYDNDYLTYTGAAWANSVTGDANNVQLISEVTEDGGPVLNISSILNSTYSNNETIVTLNFTAKQNYTTMPVTLTNREITDSAYSPVTVSLLVDATAGQDAVQNTENDSQGGNSSTNNSSTNNSQNTNSSNNNNSSTSSTNKNTTDKKNLDKTPKTGVPDVRLLLAGAIVVFLLAATVCMRLLGKKRS